MHPNYRDNGWIYLTYQSYASHDQMGVGTLVRGRLEDQSLVEVEVLFRPDRVSGPTHAGGSRLAFAADGNLFMIVPVRSPRLYDASGDAAAGEPHHTDRQHMMQAQDLRDHAGSVLRLNDDGSVPADNPFVGRDDALPEIYSYGHRNPQGLAVHPHTGEVWLTDHGEKGGDRLDRIQPGANYGWPVVSFSREYHDQARWGAGSEPWALGRVKPGMLPPVHEFTPTIAPSGLAIVTGERFPHWRDNLLAGGLRGQHVRRLLVEHGPKAYIEHDGRDVLIEDWYVGHEEDIFRDRHRRGRPRRAWIGRIRDVRMGPDGYIYLATDEHRGAIYHIEPASP